MSDGDDLRAQLAGADPAPPLPDPAESRRVEDLLERIMATPVDTPLAPDQSPAPSRRPRTAWLAGAAAAVVLLGGGGAALALRDGDSTSPTKTPTTVALSLPGGTSIGGCVPFSVAVLKDMSPAFRGTVTSVSAGVVTLDVDTWYAGGDADRVTLTSPDGTTSSVGGVEFTKGTTYLVTAANGVVNSCGYTGPATADLQKAFDEAFG